MLSCIHFDFFNKGRVFGSVTRSITKELLDGVMIDKNSTTQTENTFRNNTRRRNFKTQSANDGEQLRSIQVTPVRNMSKSKTSTNQWFQV